MSTGGVGPGLRWAAVVSCDIVGHSRAPEPVQVERVVALNDLVAATLAAHPAGTVVWASGGDGGHVAIGAADWPRVAAGLVDGLLGWAAGAGVGLRVTLHAGPVRTVAGADGRVQLVGDTINTAGRLLERGTADGVLASAAWVAAAGDAMAFHDPRLLPGRDGTVDRVHLASTPARRSRWSGPEEDRRRLADAVEALDGWGVLHLAKRILQVDRDDEAVEDALRAVNPTWLAIADEATGRPVEVNPYLGYLDGGSLREVVRAGHLVERAAGEYLCRRGDGGDSMFVILRGRVGVLDPDSGDDDARPAFVHRPGEVVGELAFALHRRRTADLLALEDTALLALSGRDIRSRLPRNPSSRLVAHLTDRFIGARVLEHVSHQVPFLLGPNRDGPFGRGPRPWRSVLHALQDRSTLVPVPAGQLDPADPPAELRRPGLAVLVSGRLRGGVDGGTRLDGEHYPLVWLDVPGMVVLPRRRYGVETATTMVLHIDAAGLAGLPDEVREPLQVGLRRGARGCFDVDAFLSFSLEDRATAERWRDGLAARGLSAYLDETPRGVDFPPRLWRALAGARALVVLVSAQVMAHDPATSWVRREIAAHRALFPESRIVPVTLPGGRPEELVDGFAPVDARHAEAAALDQVAATLADLRDGRADPPYGLELPVDGGAGDRLR